MPRHLIRWLARWAPRSPDLRQPGLLAVVTTVVVSVTVDYATAHPSAAHLLQGALGIDWDYGCDLDIDQGFAVYVTRSLAEAGCDEAGIVTVIDSDSRTLMIVGVLYGLIVAYSAVRKLWFRLGQRYG